MKSLCTVHEHFESALARFAPDQLAFAAEDTGISWAALGEAVDRMTLSLRAEGIVIGAVVGYSLPNCPEAIALPIALSRLGACAVPLFPLMPDAVRAGIFTGLGCSLVVVGESSVEKLSSAAAAMRAPYRILALGALSSTAERQCTSIADPDLARPFLIAASSGTTGMPKSVRISQGNASSAMRASADLARLGDWQESIEPSSMIAFPLSTSSILVPLGMLLAGTRLIFSRDLSPFRFLELAAHWQATSLSAPPAYFENILGLPPERLPALPNLRAIHTGMDFLPPTLLHRLKARFPDIDRASSGYGLVETSTVFMTWKAHSSAKLADANSNFTLCPGVPNEFDVRDEAGQSVPIGQRGELWVRGSSVVNGYLGKSGEASASFVGGWFRTGDSVRRIDEQSVELCGRMKYLIKRGGKSIAPSEVQDRLDACPGVLSSAVVGVKNPLYGEMIWAFVVPEGPSSVTLKDVMRQCRDNLPNYMVPDQVTFLNELPRGTGVGKLDREKLILMANEELSQIAGGHDAAIT